MASKLSKKRVSLVNVNVHLGRYHYVSFSFAGIGVRLDEHLEGIITQTFVDGEVVHFFDKSNGNGFHVSISWTLKTTQNEFGTRGQLRQLTKTVHVRNSKRL
ncbi:hypothetical protein L596_029398 [Steinernema carpocapsae]|uniref:Uncharacterized protein n=1 Tax=Steinernema carpocapsae TaxID=34508 RepID=A0A4U5LUI7_STECR|nr:hypothetical protein L596_029398 [Steinernema carpocapsae]